MMSATDLVTFARAHMRDGIGPNGTRVLSEKSARLMRQKTGTSAGPGNAAFGLAWMLTEPGFVGHGGGGPGILSYLLAHPATDSAIAVLTNGAEGMTVIAEMTAPFLESRGGEPLGAANVKLVSEARDAPVDGAPYVGTYEGIAVRYVVEQRGQTLTVGMQSKFSYYETMKTGLQSAPLRPVRDGIFVLGKGIAEISDVPLAFVNPDGKGRTQHMAVGGRLYRRTA
jgi:hypothetical protein